ncbi:MAG: hypothetical protein ACRDL2_13035 [Gaiellaceae bacterium]
MEAPVTEVYKKPEIKDLGTLQELTAACITPGSGDHLGLHLSTSSISSSGFCLSS